MFFTKQEQIWKTVNKSVFSGALSVCVSKWARFSVCFVVRVAAANRFGNPLMFFLFSQKEKLKWCVCRCFWDCVCVFSIQTDRINMQIFVSSSARALDFCEWMFRCVTAASPRRRRTQKTVAGFSSKYLNVSFSLYNVWMLLDCHSESSCGY